MWNLTYTYDNLEVDLADDMDWDDILRLMRGFKPGDALTQVTIRRKDRT